MKERNTNLQSNAADADPLGYIHSIESCGTVDGPGIRYVAFLQGCPLRCLYCHNPDSWKFGSGQVMHASALVADILKYRVFIRNGGVTLSGGEPLSQGAFVANVFSRLQAEGIHTAIDTSGIIPVAHCDAALAHTDLVILDIKSLDPQLCRQISGADNRHALALLDWCEQQGKAVWIRHVIVPGYTDRKADLEALAAYLKAFTCMEKVQLLPFHQMALHKWEHLDVAYTLHNVSAPSIEAMHIAREIFRLQGLPCDPTGSV